MDQGSDFGFGLDRVKTKAKQGYSGGRIAPARRYDTCLIHSRSFAARVPARPPAGLPGIHFHDLRHTGNTLTANARADLRELMERMCHSSTRPR